MANEFVFTMQDVRKVYPPSREVLKGITLAFLPGAKIGVLGNNGSGKSTLLRIMAGVDRDFSGEARPTPGIRVGYLPQEPPLDETRDVKGNVELAVQATRELLLRFEDLGAKLGESMPEAEYDKVMAEYGRVQEEIDRTNAWELDRRGLAHHFASAAPDLAGRHLSRVVVGRGATLGADVDLRDCVIFDGSVVPDGARLTRAIVTPEGVLQCQPAEGAA